MVMEAIPSPDAVGREFVRQYYTLLNRAPTHAHRFYNSNSYFVHGAMSKPAIGQKQIHQKIQQLNFRDCHAKISQVDSQATLGNGLVVQVKEARPIPNVRRDCSAIVRLTLSYF